MNRATCNRGPNCRQRETEEQEKREALTKAQTNKAMTEQAARLDGQIATVNGRLDKAPAVVTADPQASTFSQLTGISVDTSAALYAFMFSIALETAAMFAMMVAYSSPEMRGGMLRPEGQLVANSFFYECQAGIANDAGKP
jgi:hypothetical protein